MLLSVRSLHVFLFVYEIYADAASAKVLRHSKSEYGDKSLWKNQYEDELTKAIMTSKRRDNHTRISNAAASMSDNESVVEKIMDTISSSGKYLRKIDSIDFRLNRLDIEVHEKTNTIIKLLADLSSTSRQENYVEKFDVSLDNMKNDITYIKKHVERSSDKTRMGADGSYMREDSSLDSRLSYLENHMKSIMAGVESIVSIISEVKNRQYPLKASTSKFASAGEPAGHNYSLSDSGGSFDSLSILNEFRKTIYDQKAKKCGCRTGGRVDRSERYPSDCFEIQMQGFNVSGIYKIKPEDLEAFYILCDLNTSGGGWTVIQNRYDGSQDFYKGWLDYKNGFGNLAGEFWLGLEKVHFLTNQKLYELRVEVETQHGQDAYAGYSVFTVGPEHEGFRISTLGTYYGTAGDSLTYHAGQKFSTFDTDNDEWKDGSCATEHGGAWWYKECDKSNLNGRFSSTTDDTRGQSVYWISFKGPNFPLSKTKMMIRPLPASRPLDFDRPNRKSPETVRVRHGDRKPDDKFRTEPLSPRGSTYLYEDSIDTKPFFPNY